MSKKVTPPTEDSISSSEDFPAKISATPESELAWRVRDRGSGTRWLVPFAFYNPDWSSSKMSQESCAPWLGDRESLLSESSLLTWPSSGTTLDGVAYELPMWEPLISEVESSSQHGGETLLPTPSANDRTGAEGKSERKGRGAGGAQLRDLPKLLPTPAAEEARGTAEQHLARKNKLDGANRTSVTSLGILVKTLPTPTAGDANSSGSRNLEGSKAKPGMSLTDWVKSGDSSTPRLLPTPMANEENPGSGGELRAALTHGPGRRNGTGVDTQGRPNTGRPSRLLPTPMQRDGESSSEQGLRGEGNQTLLGAAREMTGTSRLLPTPTTQDASNNAGPSQHRRNSDPLNVVVAKTLLPTPTAHAAGRGRGSAERYKGAKSQGSQRSNLEDAIEAVEDRSPWIQIGESLSPQSDDGRPLLDPHPDQLTLEGDSIPVSASGCSDSPKDGST